MALKLPPKSDTTRLLRRLSDLDHEIAELRDRVDEARQVGADKDAVHPERRRLHPPYADPQKRGTE